MRNQYGFFFDGIGKSQIITEFTYSLGSVDTFKDSICVFYDRVDPIFLSINYPLMNALNVSKYKRVLITTSLNTTVQAREMYFDNKPIYYYCYNLEWTYNPHLLNMFKTIMSDPKIKVIVRCQDHADKIFEDFGKEVIGIVNTANAKGLINATVAT